MSEVKIKGTAEAWEHGDLGENAEYATKDNSNTTEIDDALAIKPISIRMPDELIEDLKAIAKIHGLRGYQTLMKQVLKRFVEAEKKHALRTIATQVEKSGDSSDRDVMSEQLKLG